MPPVRSVSAPAGARSQERGHTYLLPHLIEDWPADPELGLEAGEAWSVTSILQICPKPWMGPWASKLEAQAWEQATKDAIAEPGWPNAPPPHLERVKARLGPIRQHVKELEKASDIGKQAHEMIDCHLKSKPYPMKPEEMSYNDWGSAHMVYEGWARWFKLANIETINNEAIVYNKHERVAGTVDFIGLQDGVTGVYDWKSSKAIYDDHRMQVSTYVACAESLGRMDITEGCIIRLPKTAELMRACVRKHGGPFEVERLTGDELTSGFITFQAIHRAFDALKRYEYRRKKRK